VKSKGLVFVFLGLFFIYNKGCTPSTTCTSSDGTEVDFSTPFGSWKKVSGYSTPKSTADLELNFDVLIVEPGNRICLVRVVNGAVSETVFQGTYVNDVTLKRIAIEIDDETLNASWRISGGCSDPTFSLSYDNGSAESYEIRSKDLSQVSCSADSGSQ
jgi:hypothetical protein